MSTFRIALAAIPEDRPHRIEVGETPILLIRHGAEVSALAAACPHAGAPLEKGAVCEGRLICPWHKAAFAVRDGALLEPPALAALTRYTVRIEDGFAIIDGREAEPAPTHATFDGTIAIVGAGAAASGALALLQARGHAGRVIVIGQEAAAPYDRTVLSKMVIGGKMPAAPKALFEAGLEPNVELVVGEVVGLDAGGRTITLRDGRTIGYERALAASGGAPKWPGLPGEHLTGVHVLRSVADAASLVDSIGTARRAVILGAGFIGLEVASGLRERGVGVTVIASGTPLARVFGERIGGRLRALAEDKGVVFSDGKVVRFEGGERVERVVLEDGTVLACDLAVLGTGVAPNVGFIEGVTLDDGVVVGPSLLAAPDLYAAGDIARFAYRGEQVRIEHWRLAQQHGWLAARNMLGEDAIFEGVPFFWTAQHGKRIDYLGHAESWDDEVIDGDLASLDFVAFLVRGGVVAAAIGCGRDTQMARLSDAMRRDLTVAEARTISA